MKVLGPLLEPLEDLISNTLLKELLRGRDLTPDERLLMALPGALGGMAIDKPNADASFKFTESVARTLPLVDLILQQQPRFSKDVQNQLKVAKHKVKAMKAERLKTEADQLKARLSPPLQRAMSLAQEKGASEIITTLCLESEEFFFHKGDWCDTIDLRYSWTPPKLPCFCPCGKAFTLSHSQCCAVGGFRNMRHNNVRDSFVKHLSLVLNDVGKKPVLQPVPEIIKPLLPYNSNMDDDARADIRAKGFWTRNQSAFFDVRVFFPNADSYKSKSIPAAYRGHENEKKLSYCKRIIEVEHGTFTPLVFMSTGSASKETSIIIKKTAAMIAEKKNQPYSQVVALFRARLAFEVMRSAIMMLRGSRRYRTVPLSPRVAEVVNREAAIHVD
jgi:hypothetical protein